MRNLPDNPIHFKIQELEAGAQTVEGRLPRELMYSPVGEDSHHSRHLEVLLAVAADPVVVPPVGRGPDGQHPLTRAGDRAPEVLEVLGSRKTPVKVIGNKVLAIIVVMVNH